MQDEIVIAVDGPAAAGKTTASTAIARDFAISYLESGRAYRLLAYNAIKAEIDFDNEDALIGLCDEQFLSSYDSLVSGDRRSLSFLRDPQVGRAVSVVAKLPAIRSQVTLVTRSWAKAAGSCIVEGRDIGTVVFPDAPLKFYLDAGPEVRASRRLSDEPGNTYDSVLRDVLERDRIDSTRDASPLRPAVDSIVIDTSQLSVEQVYNRMTEHIGRL